MSLLLVCRRLPARGSSLLPLPRDLFDRVIRASRIQPENLNGMDAANLHFQSAAGRRELQTFFGRLGRGDHAQTDLGHVRAGFRGLHRRNRAGDHGRVPTVELRTLKQSSGMAHVVRLTYKFYRLERTDCAIL
jgi:hypothetical protein